ncbi:MAG: trypsin-like peptidase domain-containing protein [Lewinellaceae bacterium]|nr:trypsin-like peptidase domain-containing protein [Lewinellaceae bacterium]
MIRHTLQKTKMSTFAIVGDNNGIYHPFGTGFFVSEDGWFVTAAHVLFNQQSHQPNFDHRTIVLMRDAFDEQRVGNSTCCYGAVHEVLHNFDFALLKIDETELENSQWLKDGKIDHLTISEDLLEEAEPVYSYGYPLSQGINITNDFPIDLNLVNPNGQKFSINTSVQSLCPRITSAIISSVTENSLKDSCECPDTYVLDKALNYGNSGGPIISVESGLVHGICSYFQPVFIPQQHLNNGQLQIMIPSLYGVVKNLSIKPIIDLLKSKGIVTNKK